jgi:hypothetical protein
MAMPLRAKRWIPKTVVTPDYTNQLDLFSEAPIDTPAPIENTPPRIPGGAHARPRPPQQLGFEALEPRPTKTLCSLLSIDSRLPKLDVSRSIFSITYEHYQHPPNPPFVCKYHIFSYLQSILPTHHGPGLETDPPIH